MNEEPKPKRKKRKAITDLPPVELDPNRYQATDDDLPINFWPEPDFEEEKKDVRPA